MKILCLTSEFPPRVGGIASHVDELTRHLSLLDNTLTVFSPADRTLPCSAFVAVDSVQATFPFIRMAAIRRSAFFLVAQPDRGGET